MRMVKLTIPAEIIDYGNFPVSNRFMTRLRPDSVPVRTGVLLVVSRSPGDQIVAIWCCSEHSWTHPVFVCVVSLFSGNERKKNRRRTRSESFFGELWGSDVDGKTKSFVYEFGFIESKWRREERDEFFFFFKWDARDKGLHNKWNFTLYLSRFWLFWYKPYQLLLTPVKEHFLKSISFKCL